MSAMTSGVAVAVSARTVRFGSTERRQRVQIRWAEIVPPLADAMRLVDHDEIDGTTGELPLEIW
jgi:uncharacterized membrane protein SirB2